jgi:hypothetical protein
MKKENESYSFSTSVLCFSINLKLQMNYEH